jgi:hypothetical protein
MFLFFWGFAEVATSYVLSVVGDRRPFSIGLPIAKDELLPKHRAIIERLVKGDSTYLAFDPTLGWTVKPNGKLVEPGSGIECVANSQGLRGDRDYSASPPEGTLRLAAFGDSFTHGDEVGNKDTWEASLERVHKGAATFEVMNFGIGGSAPDQAYLRYQKERGKFGDLAGSVVFIGFMTENVYRMVNVYRPFYIADTSQPLTKPRYKLDGDKLTSVPNPLPSLDDYKQLLEKPAEVLARVGRDDYFYQTRSSKDLFHLLPTVRLVTALLHDDGIVSANRFRTDSEAYRVLTGVLDDFYAEVQKAHAVPVIVLFPHSRDVKRRKKGEAPEYAPLADRLKERHVRFVDMIDVLTGDPHPLSEVVPSHYTPLGNELVARALDKYLVENGLDTPDGVKKAVEK